MPPSRFLGDMRPCADFDDCPKMSLSTSSHMPLELRLLMADDGRDALATGLLIISRRPNFRLLAFTLDKAAWLIASSRMLGYAAGLGIRQPSRGRPA